jgi:hypothetical protein
VRTTFDFQVVATPVVEPSEMRRERATAPDGRRCRTEPPPRQTGDGTPWRHVTLAQLINAGLVRVPLDIEHRYRGTQLKARIEQASRIVFDGRAYDSLSTAGGVARKSIVGSPPGRVFPQTNGWTFWQFRSPDGTLRVLDELRREFHERKVVSLVDSRRAEA